jgi:hypothetical protein
MNISMKSRVLVAILAMATPTFIAVPALGQRDATSKALGNYNSLWSGNRAGRSVRHATDYSRGLHQYATGAPQIAPQAARQEVAGVSQNLMAAKQDYAVLRKAASDDRETIAILDAIDKHLAAADAELKAAHACCEAPEVDSKMLAECCSKMTTALEKAHAEHEKLMKRIEVARAALRAEKKAK